MSLEDQTKAKMVIAIDHLKNELKNIRTGRANPGMVEHILVEVYGTPMRLKDVASITTPEARQLLITPFDPKNAALIGKGIEKANIGFTPVVDGHSVRLKIPPMTEEIRKKMAKLCHEERERAKIALRNARRESNEAVRKLKSTGELAEDAMKRIEKHIQELTDKYCKEADDLCEVKEKEIATI